MKLPKKLSNEPLIDAIFEIRFKSDHPVSVIFPGLILKSLQGYKNIEALPINQLPKQARDSDLNLRFAPLCRIECENFFINISDFSVSISSKYPYAGWKNFKETITLVVTELEKSSLIGPIERYSMKYIDLIDPPNGNKASMVNVSLTIAEHTLSNEEFQIRLEIPEDEITHAVQVISSAEATLYNGKKIKGLLIDVDSYCLLNDSPLSYLMEHLEERLENMHMKNKKMFFKLLKKETLDILEPIYE
jgi:uncharacterized protein (TIGR04255 family)